MVLRKISLKIACKLAIKTETVSCPCNTCYKLMKNTYCMCKRPFLYLYYYSTGDACFIIIRHCFRRLIYYPRIQRLYNSVSLTPAAHSAIYSCILGVSIYRIPQLLHHPDVNYTLSMLPVYVTNG